MTIEERVQTLERELHRERNRNRWLLAGWLLAVGGAIAGFTQQPGKTQPISTTELRVVDADGRTRVKLFVDKDGPNLVMNDKNGETRVGLFVDKDGSMLSMRDENGKARAMLSTHKDGAMLSMADENGKPRAVLSADKDGSMVSMRDENGKARAMLYAGKGGPSLSIADEDGKDRAVVGSSSIVSPSGNKMTCSESTIMLFGPDGTVLWTNPTK